MYERKCPQCERVVSYKYKQSLTRAIEQNRLCSSCVRKRENLSEETLRKLRKASTGRVMSEETKRKISEANKGKVFSEESRRKMSKAKRGRSAKEIWGPDRAEEIKRAGSERWSGENNPNYGNAIQFTTEYKKNLRKAHLKRIQAKGIEVYPNYNPSSIPILEEYARKNNLNLQHAENGGEFYIEELGYWVDGYDSEKNVVVEYYENHHYRQSDRDNSRKKEIIDHLGCTFIEIWESRS